MAPDRDAPDLAAAMARHRAGDLDEAEGLYRAILERDPGRGDALNLLGVLLAQRGRADEAAALIVQAVAADGSNPEYHYNLGLARQAAMDRDGAIDSYRQAIALRPDYADALSNLGNLLAGKGEAEEAERCHRRALRLDAGNPVAHGNLGTVLLVRDAPQAAEASFRDALRLWPDYGEAHNGLGLALSALGRLDEAVASFREALALDPENAEAHNNLGTALFELDRFDEAEAELRKALDERPGYRQARLNLALLLSEREAFDDALALYDEVLQTQPDSAVALAGRALALDMTGRSDEAEDIVRRFTAEGALPATMIVLLGRMASRQNRPAEAIATLERLAEGPALPRRARCARHFTLARLHDETGEFDQAFAHLELGNALRANPHDPAGSAAAVDCKIEYFSAERAARLPRVAREAGAEPVFIVGMPRSGTSLIDQVLSCHRAVFAAGEMRALPRLARSLGAGGGAAGEEGGFAPRLDGGALARAARDYRAALGAVGPEVLRVTDKMPHNFQHLGLIALLFPGARIIHCLRDPLDTCLSCYFQNFAGGNFYAFDLGHLAQYYRQYQRLMAHWASVVDLPMFELRYEDHVGDPEGACRRVLEFLDLDWDPRCLRFHDSPRIVKTASRDQVRRPVYTSAVGRWRHYERHLGPLKAALGQDAP